MNLPKLKLLLAACGLALAGGLRAQESSPARHSILFPELPDSSPKCTLKQRVGLTDIEIIYSRPNMQHHLVFGGIVPFGDFVWRTGDKASTKINFSTPVKLDGEEIPAGKYALYTIVGEKQWRVGIYKDPGLWGAEEFDNNKIVKWIEATPQRLTDPVKSFTIDFDDIQDDSAVLCLKWATTLVPVKVQVDVVPDALIKLAGAMSSPGAKTPKQYLDAATFYLDHTTANNDLAQAAFWVDQGLKDNPATAYELLYLKARIQARQGDREGAAETAQTCRQLALQAEGPGTPYMRLTQEILSGARR